MVVTHAEEEKSVEDIPKMIEEEEEEEEREREEEQRRDEAPEQDTRPRYQRGAEYKKS